MVTHSGKRTRVTVALSIALVALLAIIAWMELGGNTNTTQAKKVVNSIVITRQGHDDIALVKANSGPDWRMIKPFSLIANTQRIEPLVSLAQVKMDTYSSAEVDLAETGLNQPKASITFDDLTYSLGFADAGGERRYVLVDDKVGFVPEWTWSLVHGGVTAFADLSVFDELPDVLYLVEGEKLTELRTNPAWTELQADKIIAWPDQSISDSGNGRVLQLNSAKSTSGTMLATITQLSEFAVISTQAGFAYAISNSRLNALLNP